MSNEASVYEKIVEYFDGDCYAALKWYCTSNKGLLNRSPSQAVIDGNIDSVLSLLEDLT